MKKKIRNNVNKKDQHLGTAADQSPQTIYNTEIE